MFNSKQAASLSLIWAQSRGGVIGLNGTMPWHLPEDLAHFKALTLGQPVVMGRKTWESLPSKFRPLPGRLNVVVTRQEGWRPDAPNTDDFRAEKLPNATLVAHSLTAALKLTQSQSPNAWVIGGADLYAQALPLAQRLEVTHIHADFAGDAYAPQIDAKFWQVRSSGLHTATNGLQYEFCSYQRVG